MRAKEGPGIGCVWPCCGFVSCCAAKAPVAVRAVMPTATPRAFRTGKRKPIERGEAECIVIFALLRLEWETPCRRTFVPGAAFDPSDARPAASLHRGRRIRASDVFRREHANRSGHSVADAIGVAAGTPFSPHGCGDRVPEERFRVRAGAAH